MRKILIALTAIAVIASCRKDDNSARDLFRSQMNAAMQKMMETMETVPKTMDPDVDFAKMMIPHHQGAIDMADAVLKVSEHADLAAMAREIKTESQDGIARLNHLLVVHGTPVPMTGTGFMPEMEAVMKKMDQTMKAAHYTEDPDYDFAQMMIHHHQGAIDMARIELKYGVDSGMKDEARMIVEMQEQEIVRLAEWLNTHGEPKEGH